MNKKFIKKLKKQFGNQLKEIIIKINPQFEKDVSTFIQALNKANKSTINSKLIFK